MKDVDSYTLLTGCQILRLSSLEDLIRNVSFQGFLLYLCVTFSTNSSSTSIFRSGQRLFTFLNSTKIYNHLIQTDILTSHRLHSETNSEKSLPSPTCISHRASVLLNHLPATRWILSPFKPCCMCETAAALRPTNRTHQLGLPTDFVSVSLSSSVLIPPLCARALKFPHF